MLDIDGAFFLQIPDETNQRILHPAKVVGLDGNTYTAEIEEQDLDIAEGQDVFILFEVPYDFLQQAAHILTISGDEPKPTFEFATTGEPTSIESRQHYRVSTVTAGLTVELAAKDRCPLVDVSCTGFSVISGREHAVGNLVEATLIYEAKEYNGKVCVQSTRELSKGRIRYGLYCLEDRASAGNMPRGLRRMSVALQSEQLRRLAGIT